MISCTPHISTEYINTFSEYINASTECLNASFQLKPVDDISGAGYIWKDTRNLLMWFILYWSIEDEREREKEKERDSDREREIVKSKFKYLYSDLSLMNG